jgi:PadR family transcriptional regulator, regulatory protein PadR
VIPPLQALFRGNRPFTFYLNQPIPTIMDIENAKAQMRKGVLEFCILSILQRGEAYPSDILGELKEAKLLIVEGTLYPLLTRLKNDGLLTYRWEESQQGPPRKYYSLTESGACFLIELRKTWDDLAHAVNQTTNSTKP